MDVAIDEGSSMGLGVRTGSNVGSSTSAHIDSSNIGFQLLKKHGWKEGTGLGVSEQGRLEPVQAFIKNNKRGLGAEKPKKAIKHEAQHPKVPKDKAKKAISKKMRKMQEFEKQLQEKEFDRAFFREFWPDNV